MADIEASEKKWSATANLYIRYFEACTVTVGINLLTSMKFRFSSSPLRVIECGAGAGALALEIIRILNCDDKLGHELTIIDLSETMMNLARERIQSDSSSSLPVTTLVGDATSLSVPDASFDRYVCSMTVHYAPDADSWFRESLRVLSPGGIAGFTVWGHEATSHAMTLLGKVKSKFGLGMSPPARSSYHMGEDDSALRGRVLDAGYSSCVVWHAPAVIESISAEDFVETMLEGSYSTKQEVLTWPQETQELVRRELVAAAEGLVEEQGQPLALDVCYIIAKK